MNVSIHSSIESTSIDTTHTVHKLRVSLLVWICGRNLHTML